MNLTIVALVTATLYIYSSNLSKWQYMLMFSYHYVFNYCQVVQIPIHDQCKKVYMIVCYYEVITLINCIQTTLYNF